MDDGAGRKAVFLDRDGTLNEEVQYLHRPEDFAFIPGAAESVRRLREAGYLAIVVTNQSGVARGYFSEAAVLELHRHIQRELSAAGTAIDAFYFCPHHPDAVKAEYRRNCDCRKGKPGMLLQAAQDHNLDLGASWMVGDKLADVEAALRAGCRPILVRTGYGRSEEAGLGLLGRRTLVVDDLPAAIDRILEGVVSN